MMFIYAVPWSVSISENHTCYLSCGEIAFPVGSASNEENQIITQSSPASGLAARPRYHAINKTKIKEFYPRAAWTHTGATMTS